MRPSNDIVRALAIIDQRIESLKEIRQRLAEEFGVGDGIAPAEEKAATDPAQGMPEKSKKGLLSEFIREHGPQTRKYLLLNAGLKPGTLATCLNDKTQFKQLEDGRWGLREEEAIM